MNEAVHLVCTQCDSIVRVPADRLTNTPRCPKCHVALFRGGSFELTTARFDRHAQRSDLPLVVDVWAPWCGPCTMMAPHYETTAQKLQAHARFAKINADEEPMLSTRFGIRGIPTLLVFQHGRELTRQSGAMDPATLLRWVTSALPTRAVT